MAPYPSPPPVTAGDPAVRSAIYKLLSIGFSYPTDALFAAIRDGEYLAELLDRLCTLPGFQKGEWELFARTVREGLSGTSPREFEVNFARTFDVGAPSPPLPPYEGAQRKGEVRTAILLEVSEFYRHFGLSMNQEEGKRELPDHLCAELEFLHFLSFKEAQARQAEEQDLLRGYLLAQRDFLDRHLLQWVPAFAEKLGEDDAIPFYGLLGRLTAAFLQKDAEWLDSSLRSLQ